MKNPGAAAVANLINSHYNNDETKFRQTAEYIADGYEDIGDMDAAEIIRKQLDESDKKKTA